MNKGFVPFAAAAPAPAPGGTHPRATVVTDATSAKPFRPVSEGVPACPTAAGAEPKVTLERDGDRITRIKVECGCGRITELVCSY